MEAAYGETKFPGEPPVAVLRLLRNSASECDGIANQHGDIPISASVALMTIDRSSFGGGPMMLRVLPLLSFPREDPSLLGA